MSSSVQPASEETSVSEQGERGEAEQMVVHHSVGASSIFLPDSKLMRARV